VAKEKQPIQITEISLPNINGQNYPKIYKKTCRINQIRSKCNKEPSKASHSNSHAYFDALLPMS